MFVLHPSSRCDVCLDAFTWETEMAPHAIPCGHVFCKTCLQAVIPPKCPLCRKNYDPARLKKLHVDRPDGSEDPKEGELLQRIALSFEAPEEHLSQLLTEVETWLQEKHENSCKPLRKAREAVTTYQQMKAAKTENSRAISQLQSEIRDYCRQIAAEKDSAEAIERGLLAGSKELELQLTTYKTEVERLRAELHRRTYTKNPLPAPPEPISLDRYPGFAQAAAAGIDPWYNDHGKSMIGPMKSVANGTSYVHPRNLYPDDERENQALVLHEVNGSRRDRKGKTRENSESSLDIYRSSYLPVPQTQIHTAATNGNYTAIEAPAPKVGIIPGASPSRKFMPPDPEAERKRGWNAFKPPDPVLQQIEREEREERETGRALFDPARDAVDPWSLTASLLPEYTNGWAEGYTAAVQSTQTAAALRSKSRTNNHHETGSTEALNSSLLNRPERNGRERHRERGRDRDHDRPSTSHRSNTALIPEAISMISSGPVRALRRADDSTRSRTHRHQASDVDSANISQPQAVLASILSDNPSSRRARSRPRTSIDVSQSQALVPIPPQPVVQPISRLPVQPEPPLLQPLPRPPHQQSLTFDESADMETPDSRRSQQTLTSISSWGTVSTGVNNPQLTPGSFASLNLRGFSRNPVLTTAPQPYRSPVRPFPHLENSDDEAERAINGRTPRTVTIPAELSSTAHAPPVPSLNRLTDERSPARRVSYPIPAPVSSASASTSHGSRHTQAIAITHHYQNPTLAQRPPSSNNTDHSQNRGNLRTSNRHHGQTQGSRPGRLSSAAASLSTGNTAVPHSAPATGYEWPDDDGGYHTDAPQSGNALGLALDMTIPSGPSAITAPTPIVSSRSFLRSFSYDNFTQ